MKILDMQGHILLEDKQVRERETVSVIKLSKKVSLAGANLGGADMRYVIARSVNFRGANFQKADFTQADLSRADLRGVNFRNGEFLYCRMREAIFDDTCVLHWRSHDLLSALLRFVAAREYARDEDRAIFIKHALYAGIPHMFREWCWPEYNQYLPKDASTWMSEALRPWVLSDPSRDEYVPEELLEELGF